MTTTMPRDAMEPITSRMAVATLVVGAVALVLSVLLLGLLLGPVALGLGILALVQIARSEGRQGGKPLAVVGMVLGGCGLLVSVGMAALIAMGMVGYMRLKTERSGGGSLERLMAKEDAYTKASMAVLGEELAARYPGKTVLVLKMGGVYADASMPERVEMLIASCGDGLTVVQEKVVGEKQAPEEGADKLIVDLFEGLDPVSLEVFDAAMAKHPNVDVVVVFGYLPVDYQRTMLWRQSGEEGQPDLVLVDENIHMLQDEIASGKVAMALCQNPDTIYDPLASLPSGVRAIFDERYLLITQETVGAVAEMYPELFREKSPGKAAVPEAGDNATTEAAKEAAAE